LAEEDGLLRARAATKILFDSDYSELRANDIISAFSGDHRLVFCEEADLALPITKLAAQFRLVPSSSKYHEKKGN
jgi:tyrosyl-tRNA synthetase